MCVCMMCECHIEECDHGVFFFPCEEISEGFVCIINQ